MLHIPPSATIFLIKNMQLHFNRIHCPISNSRASSYALRIACSPAHSFVFIFARTYAQQKACIEEYEEELHSACMSPFLRSFYCVQCGTSLHISLFRCLATPRYTFTLHLHGAPSAPSRPSRWRWILCVHSKRTPAASTWFHSAIRSLLFSSLLFSSGDQHCLPHYSIFEKIPSHLCVTYRGHTRKSSLFKSFSTLSGTHEKIPPFYKFQHSISYNVQSVIRLIQKD